MGRFFLASISALVLNVGMVNSLATADDFESRSLDIPTHSIEETSGFRALGIQKPELLQRCCKVCTKGKACGDTCIPKDRTCHVGPGCACNG